MPWPPPVTTATRPLRLKRSRYMGSKPPRRIRQLIQLPPSTLSVSPLVRQIIRERRSNATRPQRGQRIGKGADVDRIVRQIAEDMAQFEEGRRVAARRLRRFLQALPVRIVRR